MSEISSKVDYVKTKYNSWDDNNNPIVVNCIRKTYTKNDINGERIDIMFEISIEEGIKIYDSRKRYYQLEYKDIHRQLLDKELHLMLPTAFFCSINEGWNGICLYGNGWDEEILEDVDSDDNLRMVEEQIKELENNICSLRLQEEKVKHLYPIERFY